MKKIIFTGGTGRFARIFRSFKHRFKISYPKRDELDIENFNSILRYLSEKKPHYLIHCAGLSRPMEVHDKDISKSIITNIIGTSNIVRACSQKNIKLIYFSTNYVYPGKKGNYSEDDPVLPINNYAISKLGGECAVQLYKNSLILRICMTEKPFVHKTAFSDVKLNFMYHQEVANILKKVINIKGILNLGGPAQSVYQFAKKDNPNIKKISIKKIKNAKIQKNLSMNISKLKKIIN